ncbi:MAG: alanine racemase [Clostridia bacterium]|nr:alanine racemase [Clostridia bacterium]
MNYRNWCEIDLGQIKQNYRLMKRRALKNQQIMAVVKANAYGHGSQEVSRALQEEGCDFFAVATLEEGVELRNVGIKGEILVLGYTPYCQLENLVRLNLSQTAYSMEYFEILSQVRLPIKIHLAFDTGMNRLGFNAGNGESSGYLLSLAKGLIIEGAFTHLSCADDEKSDWFTKNQIEKFKGIIKMLPNSVRYVHFANSSGYFRFNDGFSNLVRLGGCIYGLGNVGGIKPVLKWKSIIIMLKLIKKGDYVGYGLSFKADKDITVATVSCGYADGYSRGLSGVGKVVVKDKTAPIIGRICMDMLMVDVSGIDGIRLGEEVTLIGDKYTAKDMAKGLATIDYEITCNISQRVKRVYADKDESSRKNFKF